MILLCKADFGSWVTITKPLAGKESGFLLKVKLEMERDVMNNNDLVKVLTFVNV